MSSRLLKITVAVITLLVVMSGVALLVISKARHSRSDLPRLARVPEFEFQERSGKMFGLADMRGRLNVVNFFFARCQGPCPIMAGHLSELYRLYGKSEKIRLVSITVDPEHDSLEVLRQYAIDWGVTDDQWVFLRGDLELTAHLSQKGFLLAADDLPAMHSTKFVLVDQEGIIRGYYGGTEPAGIELLKTHIRELARTLP